MKFFISSLALLSSSAAFASEKYDCKIDSYYTDESPLPDSKGSDVSCSPWKVDQDAKELGTVCSKKVPIVDIEEGESFATEYEGLKVACSPWKVVEGSKPTGISCTMEGLNSNIFSSLSTKKADVFLGAPKASSEPYTVYLSCSYSEN